MEVLNALNVDEGGEVITVLDQAAGDAGDRRLDGHAGVHECERGAADGALRRGAVGREHLGHHADGVRELLDRRDDALQRLLDEGAVTVLAAVGAAGGAGVAGGVRRHIVVVHEALFFLFPDGVELLGHGQRRERGDGQHLRLAAGEQAGAVHARNHADLGIERADLVHLAAVNAVTGEQPLLDDLFLHLVEDLVHVLHHVRVLLFIFCLHGGDPFIHARLAHVLVVGVHAVLHGLHLVGAQELEQVLVKGRVLILELRLADLADHLVDEVEHGLQVLMRLHDALVHDIVRHLVGLGLDHDDLLVRGRDGGGHAVGLALLLRGVEEVLLPVPAEDDAGDGAVERHVGDAHRGARADHGGDLRAAVAVDGQDLAGDDDVVAQVAREERAHRAVDQAAGKHGGQAGLALAAHEAAGDAADGVELFVEVNGQREVIHTVFRAGGGRAGDEHGRLAVADEDGGVAQLCEFAGLHHEGTAFILDLVALVVGELLVRGDDHGFWCSFLLLAETPEPALASASHARWGADSNTGQRRSRKWAAGANEKSRGTI